MSPNHELCTRGAVTATACLDFSNLAECPPDLMTLGAPSLPQHVAAPPLPAPAAAKTKSIGDFQLLRTLGSGGAGTVYLARDCLLDRHVALKVCHNTGGEAQAMAGLQHPNIVQVYSEIVDADHDQRVICMQHVPGATLFEVLRRLNDLPMECQDGKSILAAIEELTESDVLLHAADLHGRAALAKDDSVTAACRIGVQVAEALAHAHERGVLHRDVKPSNILINPCGRPLLTDFGLASNGAGADEQPFGGTLAYMAPEHLAAFRSRDELTEVDVRSDIYSLGVVLFQWLTGGLPFPSDRKVEAAELTRLEQQKRQPVEALRVRLAALPRPVADAILRCLEPDPARRFPSADELSAALRACVQLRRADGAMPAAGPLTRFLANRRFAAGTAITFWPHLIAALACPTYVLTIVRGTMAGTELAALIWATVVFTAVALPLMGLWVFHKFSIVFRTGALLDRAAPIEQGQLAEARRRLVAAPQAAVTMACCAWAPLLVLIPGTAAANGHMFGPLLWAHFAAAVMCGLTMAASFTFLTLQYAVVRVWYLQFWAAPAELDEQSRDELSAAPARSRRVVWMVGLTPLVGAISLIGIGPQAMGAGYLAFRVFTVCLVLLGACGFIASLHVLRLIDASLTALNLLRQQLHPWTDERS